MALRSDGTVISGTPTATDVRLNPLRSRSQIADFVTSMFPQLTGTTFKGTLVVEAAAGAPAKSLVATALTVKEGLLSALPVIPVTVNATTTPVPVAPSNLQATVVSASQINLSWIDNSNNETGSSTRAFCIFYAPKRRS